MTRVFPNGHVSLGPNTYPDPGPQFPDPTFTGGSDESVLATLDTSSGLVFEWHNYQTFEQSPSVYDFTLPSLPDAGSVSAWVIVWYYANVVNADAGGRVGFSLVTDSQPFGSVSTGITVYNPPAPVPAVAQWTSMHCSSQMMAALRGGHMLLQVDMAAGGEQTPGLPIGTLSYVGLEYSAVDPAETPPTPDPPDPPDPSVPTPTVITSLLIGDVGSSGVVFS